MLTQSDAAIRLPKPREGWGKAVAVGCLNSLLVKKYLAATETTGSCVDSGRTWVNGLNSA